MHESLREATRVLQSDVSKMTGQKQSMPCARHHGCSMVLNTVQSNTGPCPDPGLIDSMIP